MDEQESRKYLRIAVIAVAVFAFAQYLMQTMSTLGSFLMMLLLAWLLSIAIEPPVAWLERHGQKRGLGAGLVLLGLVVSLVLFFGTFGSLMFSQLSAALASAPGAIESLINWLNSQFSLNLDATQVVKALKLDTSSLTPIITNLAGGVLGILGSLFSTTFEFLTILMFAFYLSADAHRVKRGIAAWLAPDRQKVFLTVWEIAVRKAGGFVVSKVVLATFSAVAHVCFFWLIGIPYWLPMGLFAGITAQFIPSIGTYLGIIIPVMFSLSSEPLDALWIVGFATFYQQIENYVLSPRVSRATMDMHPAVALGSVLVGAELFGAIGAIIGIPIVAALTAVATTYGRRHELIADLGTDIEPAAD